MQLLFVKDEDAQYVSSLWRSLQEQRDKFVSQKVVQSLSALVRRQASAEATTGYALLLQQAWRIVVGAGTTMPSEMLREEELALAIESSEASLPQHCDATVVDAWHAQVRLAYMFHNAS